MDPVAPVTKVALVAVELLLHAKGQLYALPFSLSPLSPRRGSFVVSLTQVLFAFLFVPLISSTQDPIRLTYKILPPVHPSIPGKTRCLGFGLCFPRRARAKRTKFPIDFLPLGKAVLLATPRIFVTHIQIKRVVWVCVCHCMKDVQNFL